MEPLAPENKSSTPNSGPVINPAEPAPVTPAPFNTPTPPVNLVPEPTPIPTTPEIPDTTPEKPKEVSPLKQIRTFEGDVAEAIKKQNESLISIQRAEEKKRDALKSLSPNASEEHHLNLRPLLTSLLTIVLVAGGGYSAYYAWNTYSAKTATPIVTVPENQFIGATSFSSTDASTMGRESLLALIREVRADTRGETNIEQVSLMRGEGEGSTLLTTEDLLERLAVDAPKPLIRSFSPLFMFGVLGSNPAHSLLLIRLSSFENAFIGMLDWEARMVQDILPMFVDEAELANTPSSSKFIDKTIQNHDTRVLRDSFGKTVLIYGFFDNSILIITDNEDTFRILINRLQSEKLSR